VTVSRTAPDGATRPAPEDYLYRKGKMSNTCMLILSGTVEVVEGGTAPGPAEGFSGKDGAYDPNAPLSPGADAGTTRRTRGHWSTLGAECLEVPEGSYMADFSAYVTSDSVRYLRLSNYHVTMTPTAEVRSDGWLASTKLIRKQRSFGTNFLTDTFGRRVSFERNDRAGRTKSTPGIFRSRSKSKSSDHRVFDTADLYGAKRGGGSYENEEEAMQELEESKKAWNSYALRQSLNKAADSTEADVYGGNGGGSSSGNNGNSGNRGSKAAAATGGSTKNPLIPPSGAAAGAKSSLTAAIALSSMAGNNANSSSSGNPNATRDSTSAGAGTNTASASASASSYTKASAISMTDSRQRPIGGGTSEMGGTPRTSSVSARDSSVSARESYVGGVGGVGGPGVAGTGSGGAAAVASSSSSSAAASSSFSSSSPVYGPGMVHSIQKPLGSGTVAGGAGNSGGAAASSSLGASTPTLSSILKK
jgi:hypothetical protein